MTIHAYLKYADGTAKFSINPVGLIENKGMKKLGLRIAESVIEETKDIIMA